MTKSKFLVGDFFGGGGVVASEDLRNKAEKASNQDAFLASRSLRTEFGGVLHSKCELC